MRLGIWWLKRIENLLSLQLEPPTFFLPSFFSRKKKKKLNAPLFYVASGAKGCQPSFFLLLLETKKSI